MTRAFGIDISKYDVSLVPDPPVDFVIQRASYGSYYSGTIRDEKFLALLPSVKTVGIRGAYHYFSSRSPWKAQADAFLNIVKDHGFHFFVCDVEASYNVVDRTFIASAIEWMKYVKQQTGRPVVLYTNWDIYETVVSVFEPGRAAQFPFWIAQYPYTIPNAISESTAPRMPRSRSDWHLWQYSPGERNQLGNGMVGRAGVDVNVFNGTVNDMRVWLGLDDEEVEEPPVEEEEPPVVDPAVLPQIFTVLAPAGLNVRREPYVGQNKVRALEQGATDTATKLVKNPDGSYWAQCSFGWVCVRLTTGVDTTSLPINEAWLSDYNFPAPRKFYRLRHDIENPDWNYQSRLKMFEKWGTYVGKKATGYPQTIRILGGRGNITLSPSWVQFFDAINTPIASEYTRRPDSGWFNRGTWPTVEQLSFGGNIVEAVAEEGDRIYVKCYYNTDAPPSLSSAFYDPAVIHYFTVVNKAGGVLSSPVGQIRTFIIARDRNERLWIHRKHLIPVPSLTIFMPPGG